MVDQTILAVGGVIFLVILVIILRSGKDEEPPKKLSKKEKQKFQQAKNQKSKKGKGALKKSERSAIATEWQLVDNSRDESDVLEFLKNKDPNEIAKQNPSTSKQTAKKAKKSQDEVHSSEDSATDDAALEGFEEVKKKKKKSENKTNPNPTKQDKAAPKAFLKIFNPDGTPVKKEKKKEKKPRNREAEGQEGQVEKKPRVEDEKRPRKPKSDGEQKEPGEKKKEGERKPRPPKEPREVRRPITSPPNVKYEEADINDILNSITQGYKPKPPRASSIFSKIERSLVVKILAELDARDLVALSQVNHYFMGVVRKDSLWKNLLIRDFGIKEMGKNKSFRAAYKAEYKKRKHGGQKKGKKDEVSTPLGDEKDNKGKNQKKEQVSQE